jgi:putative membrane protein
MERPSYLTEKKILVLLYLIYLVGIIGHFFAVTREYMFRLTPITLFISSLLVTLSIVDNKRLVLWLVITYLVTLTLEIFGVKTGLVFGEYYYGDILGLKFFDVPIIIGLNWVIIIWGGILFSKIITPNPFGAAVATGALALLFDIFLEPIAISFGYWSWENYLVPIRNYFAWFIIAFAFSYIYSRLDIRTSSKVPIHLFFIQLFFFLVLNLLIIL